MKIVFIAALTGVAGMAASQAQVAKPGAQVKVQGHSMHPQVRDHEVVQLQPAASIARGDIVAFDAGARGLLIKRVLGVPGDNLDSLTSWRRVYTLKNGKQVRGLMADSSLYVASKPLKGVPVPPWITDPIIPADYFYVGADSPLSSLDSRRLGLIPRAAIRGTVTARRGGSGDGN